MTSNPTTPSYLSDLMDTFAMVALEQLIPLYAPKRMEGPDEAMQWSEQIAGLSYTMAATMMNMRSELYEGMNGDLQEENEDAN